MKIFRGKLNVPLYTVQHTLRHYFALCHCQRLKESSNYNKCSQNEKMSPITSHGEFWIGGMLLFMCSRWTSLPIIQLSRTCLHFLNVGHQSVTAVITGNQCNSGQLKCDCEGGTSLYSIMGNKTAACFLSKRFLLHSVFPLFFLPLSILDIWYKEKAEEGSWGKQGWMNEEKCQELKRKPWGLANWKVWTVKEYRERLHYGPRRQSWSFFIITKIKLHPLMVE